MKKILRSICTWILKQLWKLFVWCLKMAWRLFLFSMWAISEVLAALFTALAKWLKGKVTNKQ